MQYSDSITDLAAAMAKAQAALKPAVKSSPNPAFKSKYADLAAVTDAARVYATEGVAVVQDVTMDDAAVHVRTRLFHQSGQWMEFGPFSVPVTKRDAHGTMSAVTYARRGALASCLLIAADEDDDGNAAVQGTPAPIVQTKPLGYDAWIDDLVAVADTGTPALQRAWQAAAPASRTYLGVVEAKTWAAIKARAAAVDGVAQP